MCIPIHNPELYCTVSSVPPPSSLLASSGTKQDFKANTKTALRLCCSSSDGTNTTSAEPS